MGNIGDMGNIGKIDMLMFFVECGHSLGLPGLRRMPRCRGLS